jgi:hypothetical protein
MADIKLRVRDKTRSWTLATGQRHVFQIARLRVDLVEMEDLHFHLDSAVMMPDRDPTDAVDPRSGSALTGLSVLRGCYLHAKDNPDKKVLCAGHADRSGPPDYNLALSRLRARNVRAMLLGDADEWASVCNQKHVVQDYQLTSSGSPTSAPGRTATPGRSTATTATGPARPSARSSGGSTTRTAPPWAATP